MTSKMMGLFCFLGMAVPDTIAFARTKDVTPTCSIAMPRAAREASFTVVYAFDGGAVKPTGVRKLRNDFLNDEDFTKCISSWVLQSFPAGGVAEFVHKRDGGWTSITVSDKRSNRILRLGPKAVLRIVLAP
jgi:hypothetical protein